MKIALIGAGSSQFGLGMLGDLFHSGALAGSHASLVDIDSKALDRTHDAAREYLAATGLPWTLSATVDRREALRQADTVIISIEVGRRFELWDQDWSIPQQYGIRQIYGENGGPGGVFHALRIVPVIMEICDDIAELCPDALVLNYSNPMTAICTTVNRRHPGLNFVGMCHEIASLERYVPALLGIPFTELELRAAGLNHLSVLVEARHRPDGRDLYPEILERAPAFFEREPGYSDILAHVREFGAMPPSEGEGNRQLLDGRRSSKSWADRTLFREILERYSLLPITVDSHLGEYIPWAHEVADHRGIKDFYELYRMMLAGARPAIGPGRRERAAYIIEGMLSDSGYEEPAVNIPNGDLIPALPSWIPVEVPAKVHRTGLRGLSFPDYPRGFAAILRNYCGVYDLVAEAVIRGSKEYAIQAMLSNPVVDVCRGVPEMVDLAIGRQRPYLDYLK